MWLGLLICIGVIIIIVLSDTKQTNKEKKDGIIYSDYLAKYLGGFDTIEGGKGVKILVKKDGVELVFKNNGTRFINKENIVNVMIKSQQEITSDVKLSRLVAFGALGLAMKQNNIIVKNFLIIEFKDKQDNKQKHLVFESNKLEDLVARIKSINY